MVIEELENQKVKDIVQQTPALTGVLNKYGFDFCCGGNISLKQACADAGIDVALVMKDLRTFLDKKTTDTDPASLEISELISYLLKTHHEYLKSALPEAEFYSNKVAMRHGSNHSELIEINNLFKGLKEELDGHLMKEENILFPLILEMDAKQKSGKTLGDVHCGSVNNPIRVMNFEHDSAIDAMAKIRKLSNDYTPPADACNSYRFLFQKLKEIEGDLLEHMKIETDSLFPRAIEVERKIS